MLTVTTFVLVPGAGGAAWYWHRVVPLLIEAGHEAIALHLPADDPASGLPEYARAVSEAVGPRSDVVLVAQSLGGFSATQAAASGEHPGLRALVFVNAMIPEPGETAGGARRPRDGHAGGRRGRWLGGGVRSGYLLHA